MKKAATALLLLGMLSLSAFAQSNRATRPRVAPTPTPTPEVIEDVADTQSGRKAPVLQGSPQGTTRKDLPAAGDEEDEVIKIETNLVTLPVSVLDRDGRFVSGLQQRDFKIYENGIEQPVGFFQSVEQPFTVVLMIDVSPSTAYRIDEIHRAAISFVDQLRSNDRVMVVAFDDKVTVLTRPTNNRYELHSAIRQAQFGNGTSLYVAVDQVLNRELVRVEGRKAVVIFTDGVDTTSRRASYESTIKDAEESDALIYPIRYNTQSDGFGGNSGGGGINRGSRRGVRIGLGDILGAILGGGNVRMGGGGSGGTDYETGRRYLETLAQNSGGRKFEADTTYNLDAAFAGIAEELRRQYSLGYYPENVGNIGDRKQIRIRVMRPNLVVRAKSSYIVGQSENKFAGN